MRDWKEGHTPSMRPSCSRMLRILRWPKLLAMERVFLHLDATLDRMDADGSRLHVQPFVRNIRVTDTRQVGRDHGKLFSQDRNDWLPHARCLRVAMEQDN